MGREWHRSSGCMSGMLHFIDFHRLLFTDWRTAAAHSSPQQHTTLTNLKGLEEENAVMKENHCQVTSRIRIHQVRVALEKKREKMEYFLEEERRSSQVDTPRSPGIVARLMGLELLPEPPVFYSVNSSSPTLKNTPHDHSQKKKKQHHTRKPLQIKNTNTMNCSPPPSPLSQKSKHRSRASSRHRDENENENDLNKVKQCCINNRNREAKKRRTRALCSRTEEQEDEFQYVRSVLLHAFQFKYCSHPHLINPAIFHLLELQLKFPTSSQLQHRWNRKLLFHLVGEIVGDLIHYQGFSNNMLGRVWREIRNYPLADCRVIGDIDALLAGDLLRGNVRQLLHHPAVAEEAAQVVAEVEEDILDELVYEMFTKIYV